MAGRRDGILQAEAYGRRTATESGRISTKTLFRSVSMLQPVLAVTVIQLADGGAVDLDDRIGTYVPGTNAMTSGLGPSLRELIAQPTEPEPVQHQEKLGWLGRAVERISGHRLGDHLDRCVFRPLGIRDMHTTLEGHLRHRLARVHRRLPTGELESLPSPSVDSATSCTAAPALYSSASASLTFLRALLARDMRLLNASGYRELDRTCRPSAHPADQVLVYRDSLHTYCWLDQSAGTAGLFFTQLLQDGEPLSQLFTDFRALVTRTISGTHGASGASRESLLARVFKALNAFPHDQWYL
jgi:CubicO group peptidase (beta-lactamase class C family)